MSHPHNATNGASLEDCHANFFALTDVCGIKWAVFREEESGLSSSDAPCSEDLVLSSFSRCLEAELLSVWRRVPKRDLVTYTIDMSGNRIPQQSRNVVDEKNLLSQRKELWLFWYGDKPQEQLKKLVSSQLKEMQDISGTWENGLPYEARTLLFKALNNLIERNLISKEFIRLGKWFVQPFDGPDRLAYYPNEASPAPVSKSTHLSFSFHYFIHGESSVCASVDVRQHPPVRKLSLHHLSLARGQITPVHVILAPHGLAGTLTGVTFRRDDRNMDRLLKDWNNFYPLAKNKYFCQNSQGELVAMPSAVEVMVAGVRLVYPTCYVMVSDLDVAVEASGTYGVAAVGASAALPKTMQTCYNSGDSNGSLGAAVYHVEPSPFTASTHPLLVNKSDESDPQILCSRTEQVWQDALCTNPDSHHHSQHDDAPGGGGGSQILEYLSHWDFNNPSRILKKKSRSNRQNSREKSKDSRNRFTSKIPYHKKTDIVDDLAWTMDQTDMLCGGHGSGRLRGGTPAASAGGTTTNPASMGPPGSARGAMNDDGNGGGNGAGGINSPTSIGTPVSVLTPKAPAPGSVRTPGDPASVMSPQPPASNGPLTPMECDQKPPMTPKSVPPPTSYSASASPYTNVKSVKPEIVKQEDPCSLTMNGGVSNHDYHDEDLATQESSSSNQQQQSFQPYYDPPVNGPPAVPVKRPALPLKEYELELQREDTLSDIIYDYQAMQHWLNHPVKKFRPSESRCDDPKRPMYRRNSQASLFEPEHDCNALKSEPDAPPEQPPQNVQNPSASVSSEPMSNGEVTRHVSGGGGGGNGAVEMGNGENDPYEFSDGANNDKRPEEERTDLFSTDGLKPSMSDLDNLFEEDDESDETDVAGSAPTPPDSNQPAEGHGDDEEKGKKTSLVSTKRFAPSDPAGNLPHDQLAKMFPTPPSHEPHEHHHNITSPGDNCMDLDHHLPTGLLSIKTEEMLISHDLMEWTANEDFASMVMLASPKFTPVRLYSDELPSLSLPEDCHYMSKPRSRQVTCANGQASGHHTTNNNNCGTTTAPPLGTPSGSVCQHKPGMSPISPLTSVEGPRSHHGPGSVGASFSGAGGGGGGASHDMASPASASSYLNKSGTSAGGGGGENVKTPEANALLLNIVLSDTLLNIFRDHNFDSCTLCVCNNEGNVRGRDAAVYLSPDFAGDDDVSCTCGFSAVMNRKLAHQSGLFYEDETEVTSITEDLYFRKKPSLLLLDPKGSDSEQTFNDKSAEVDNIPQDLLEMIHQQSMFSLSDHNALVKYSKEYLRTVVQPPSISMVELMDGNDVVFVALDQVQRSSDQAHGKLDDAQKGSCMHKWTLLPAPGPNCSEDIIRVMKCLQPILNKSLHTKDPASALAVEGPLTWRQFHRMAGAATKGNTDDQCEPLPVPSVTVGHEKDFLSISPLALHFWESLSIEPFSQPRDVVYIVMAPENEFLLGSIKTFFNNLSNSYELCRLGRHVSYPDIGILKVGKLLANKLGNDGADRWFDLIGDFPTAALLKLYSQVCRNYLLPLLLQMNLDRSLLESPSQKASSAFVDKPPQSPMHGGNVSDVSSGMTNMAGSSDKGNINCNVMDDGSNKENTLGGMESPTEDSEGEPPAVVIYMVDPFSFGVENCDMLRLCNLALMRCFSQIVPSLQDPLKNNIFLQLVSLDRIFELSQAPSQARMPSLMRGMAFSVYSQVQRPLQYVKDCKTLTGFGPASAVERYLKVNDTKAKFVRQLYQPAFVLAPPPAKKKSGDADSFGSSSSERSSVLFVNYCLSEDQHWLLASCCDDRGELVKTVVINVEIPNKTRRKKASARRIGLRKLMDWILSVMAMSLVPWRLVIGRIGRIGHGELRGWSVLLGRKSLKKASKQLRDTCTWASDVPSILSACLVSMEPDSNLRLLADQFTPDERFGQTASNCQLSTPKDASCTHILVFPTSATAQSSQKAFEDHQDGLGAGANDLNDFLPMDINIDNGDNDIGDIGDLDNIFSGGDWDTGLDQPGSPGSPGKRNSMSQPNSPSQQSQRPGDVFRYGQENPGERLEEFLQQPLALGYLVSTATTGHMPKWFWASCPHLENSCPTFLKSALHINQASVQQGGDDGFTPHSSSGRVHSLDSSYTTDVLRYVLEGYNALSWLSLDPVTHDRRSCLPLHVQILQQMYINFASLV